MRRDSGKRMKDWRFRGEQPALPKAWQTLLPVLALSALITQFAQASAANLGPRTLLSLERTRTFVGGWHSQPRFTPDGQAVRTKAALPGSITRILGFNDYSSVNEYQDFWWDVRTGEPIPDAGPLPEVQFEQAYNRYCLAFDDNSCLQHCWSKSADGKTVAFGISTEQTVWQEGRLVWRLSLPAPTYTGTEHCPALSADGGTLYMLVREHELGRAVPQAYRLADQTVLWKMPEVDLPGVHYHELGLSPDGTALLVILDDEVVLVNAATGKPVWRRPFTYIGARSENGRIAWSKDGAQIALFGVDEVTVLAASDGATIADLKGNLVVSFPRANEIWTSWHRIFDRQPKAESGWLYHYRLGQAAPGSGLLEAKQVLQNSHSNEYDKQFALDAAGRPVQVIVPYQHDEQWRTLVRNLSTGSEVSLKIHTTELARPTPDGTLLGSLSRRNLWLMDASGTTLRRELPCMYDFAFSPDSTRVLTGGETQSRIIDLASGNTLMRFDVEETRNFSGYRRPDWRRGLRGFSRSVAWRPGGEHVAVGYEASGVGLWNAQSGRLDKRLISQGRGWVLTLAFSPDGRTLVAGYGDGTVQFFDVQTGAAIPARRIHQQFVRQVKFSPNGRQLAAVSGDGTVSLWTPDGTPVRRWISRAGLPISVEFSPDSQRIVTGTLSGAVQVWSLGGQEQQTLRSTGSAVQSLAWGADQTLLSSDRDNALRFYRWSGP